MCCDGLGNIYFHYENEVNVHSRKVPMQMSTALNVANYFFSKLLKVTDLLKLIRCFSNPSFQYHLPNISLCFDEQVVIQWPFSIHFELIVRSI